MHIYKYGDSLAFVYPEVLNTECFVVAKGQGTESTQSTKNQECITIISGLLLLPPNWVTI